MNCAGKVVACLSPRISHVDGVSLTRDIPPSWHHQSVMWLSPLVRTGYQQTRGAGPMLGWCWASVADDGPALAQHCARASCLLGWDMVTPSLICNQCVCYPHPILTEILPNTHRVIYLWFLKKVALFHGGDWKIRMMKNNVKHDEKWANEKKNIKREQCWLINLSILKMQKI